MTIWEIRRNAYGIALDTDRDIAFDVIQSASGMCVVRSIELPRFLGRRTGEAFAVALRFARMDCECFAPTMDLVNAASGQRGKFLGKLPE